MRTMNQKGKKVATKRRNTADAAAAARGEQAAKSNRHLECALCLEQFKSPRILPCFHTFCLQCLTGLVENAQRADNFPCPTCRTKIKIPPGGVSKFQVNFYIEAEVDVESLTSQPLACATGCATAATHKCFECNQLMCDSCKRAHGAIPATKSHTILTLNSSAANAQMITRDKFCESHPQEIIRFFCQTCQTIICRDCKLTSHEGHFSCDLSSVSTNGKQFLSRIHKMFKETLEPKLKEELSSAQDHQNNLITKVEELRQELTNKAEDIKKVIDISLNEALKKLENDAKDVKYEVDAAILEMHQQMACFQSLFEHAERVTGNGVDVDVVDLPRELESFLGLISTATTYGGLSVFRQERHKLTAFTDEKWKRSVAWFQPDNRASGGEMHAQVKDYIGETRIINFQRTAEEMFELSRSGHPHTTSIVYIINILQNCFATWKLGSTNSVLFKVPFYAPS